ncbi:MAG: pyridoxal 5'-phosphate synthase glutaminase subunit PdxT [Chloroflexi bacterium]|nr:pyridoxal 5'-phosphate synthase glutaminase subunit PdxT [Chloroflexota bacterium]
MKRGTLKKNTNYPTIGVLGLQGDFQEHIEILTKLQIPYIKVTSSEDLDKINGLIIPGGESTTIIKLLKTNNIFKKLKKKIQLGLPTWGTCAGAIVLAKKVTGLKLETLKILEIDVARNAYGRQKESFSADVSIPKLNKNRFPGIFIRAPKINKISSKIKPIAKLKNGEIVGIEEKNIIVTTFHPELTQDDSLHKYFLKKISH